MRSDHLAMSSIASLRFFFNEMKAAFDNAGKGICEKHTLSLDIANHNVVIQLVGDGLISIVHPALQHLVTEHIESTQALEIFILDEKTSETSFPGTPWDISSIQENAILTFPHTDLFQITISGDREVLTMRNILNNQIIIWIRDATRILNHDYAAPLLHVLRNWIIELGLGIVHAGCVGDSSGAVLLVGKGGSGKSTTCLLSALHGLDYLSDDYTLIKFGQKPEAYCLYNTGKLHAHHLSTFPELASLAINPKPDQYEKPLIYLHQHFPQQIAIKRNLKAIIAPIVTGRRDSKLVKTSAIETLKSLAMSTLLQLRTDDKTFFKKMAGLAQTLPGYRFELGTDTKQIAPLIKQLLIHLNN